MAETRNHATDDPGHTRLLEDLRALLAEAERFEFHDFKNTTHATPKIALYQRLHKLAGHVKAGDYDNA
jgi:hypothetical protein